MSNCTIHVTKNFTNPRIHRVGNPQFFRGIIEDIREIIKGCPWNRRRVSVELLKGVRGIVNPRCLRICRRASAQSESSKASAESYCVLRIVEG